MSDETPSEEDRAEFVRLLTNADRVLVFTGAGISTGSGIPDYRGPKGVWKTRQPVNFHDFMADPEARKAYWQMKTEDWEAFAEAKPTPSHHAIAKLNHAGRLLLCVTQNIDGLHAASGVAPEQLVEIHGTNAKVECMECGLFKEADPYYKAFAANPVPPTCASCGGLWKPATISFGQALREADLQTVQDRVFQSDLVIAMGSTLSVMPAAIVPLMAARQDIPYVIVNMGPTEHDGHPLVSLRLEGPLDDIVPPAVDAALSMSG